MRYKWEGKSVIIDKRIAMSTLLLEAGEGTEADAGAEDSAFLAGCEE